MTNDTRPIVVGLMQTPPYDRMFEQSRRVYSAKGISPTLHSQGGGGREIKMCFGAVNMSAPYRRQYLSLHISPNDTNETNIVFIWFIW